MKSLFAGILLALGVARAEEFALSLHEAEKGALQTSNHVKEFDSNAKAALERADSNSAALYPHLSIEGNYRYITEVPELPPPASIPLGSNSNYSVGPMLTYTLWDTGSARDTYRSYSKLAESKEEERKNARLELLYSVRAAYIQVQLNLEELRLVNETLALARAQGKDVLARYRAGAAARVDVVTSEREVLSYELQFKHQQSELSASLKDLLARVGRPDIKNVFRPGPPNTADVELALKLDSFDKLLSEEESENIPPPDESQPTILSQELLAQSSEYSASSQKSALFPSIQLMGKSTLEYPNGPIQENINQNTLMATLSAPLFEGGKLRHEAAAKRREADAARYRKEQLKIDLNKDFMKAREMLESLREQKKIAVEDVQKSEEVARLFYGSYKAGKIKLIDVQSANIQALVSKMAAARIDAEMLRELITLKVLSGKETTGG